MAEQFQIRLDTTLVDALVNCFPAATGRDIKGLAKLAPKFCQTKNQAPDLPVFQRCAIFCGLDLAAEPSSRSTARSVFLPDLATINFGSVRPNVDELLQLGVLAYRTDRARAIALFREALETAPAELATASRIGLGLGQTQRPMGRPEPLPQCQNRTNRSCRKPDHDTRHRSPRLAARY